MSMPNPVIDTKSPSNSGCGDADISNFFRCVEGREPEVNEVWIFGEGNATPKVHSMVRIDVEYGVVYKFATNYLTENGFNTSIF